ncbi:MAG: sulfotransferase family protein [Flavobacteriales bacterium]|nr:sulfotransferase family protein [Flavobacteriales bacterium]
MTGDATYRRRLLLIRGLGHSGTTILDLALGAHPQLVGLGEAARILERPAPGEETRGPAQLRHELRFKRCCTCGSVAAECPVWGPMLDWLPSHAGLSLAEKTRRLLDAVKTVHPEARWAIDSYQDDMVLPFLEDPDLDIRILHLTRDLRSWVHSRSRGRRHGGQWLPGLKPLLRWCRVNSRQAARLDSSGRPVFRLGYEQLALDPEGSLRRLSHWLEIAFDERMLAPAQHSSSHILSGNRMRFDPHRGRSIQYDGTWLHQPSGLAQMALLLPWVARLNRRLVYSDSH